MEALEAMLTRTTIGGLREPAPAGIDLERIVAAGLAAPDHGRLRPWRFLAITGEARARFAAICIDALFDRDKDATQAEADRMRGKLTEPPLILALGMAITPGMPKVPPTEQVQAVAAAAVNMLNAAHALGFGGKWVTGPNAYDPTIARALGVPQIAGFLYLGTPAEPAAAAKRPAVADHFSHWA